MKKQKFILKSKTVWCALLSLTIAVAPSVKDGLENEIDLYGWLEVAAIALTATGTILSRYVAKDELYTPHGIPGRDYISAKDQMSQSFSSNDDADRFG